MKFGKNSFFYFLFFFNFFTFLHSEDKIKTIPLVNLENLEASFEIEESENQNILEKENLSLKEKKIKETESNSIRVNIVALDKITAKTSNINLSLGETKKFG